MCVCARVHSLGYPHSDSLSGGAGTMLEPRKDAPQEAGGAQLVAPSCLRQAAICILTPALSQSLVLKILHGGLEKGLIRKINTSLFALKMETAGLKASVWKVILQMSWKLVCFLNQRGRPKGMHCVPLIYQLPECPNPLLCSPLFLHFPTLITYLHLQHSFPTDGNITMLLVSSKNTSG